MSETKTSAFLASIFQEDPPQPQERAHVSSAEIKEERHLQAPSAPREPSPGTKLLQLSAAYERLRPESQVSINMSGRGRYKHNLS